jgi:hypothetical protein
MSKEKIQFDGDVNSASLHLLLENRAMLQTVFNINAEILSELKNEPIEKIRKDYEAHFSDYYTETLAEMMSLYGE